ncbi:hypothetical protein HDU96_005320 [Phlyctochytrium bullatum]|nr:hypothetical protein HDU96_005320 [Phlyctochytrium bullatum]
MTLSPLEPTETVVNKDGTTAHSFFDTETGTWTYVVVDDATKNAVIIDSVLGYNLSTGAVDTKLADGLLAWIRTASLTITHILETHVHADHLTAAGYLKSRLQPTPLTAIGRGILGVQQHIATTYSLPLATDGSQFDLLLADGDTLTLGASTLTVLHTPGHTPDSNSFRIGNAVYVGDVVFLPDVGSARCDFPGGSAHDLYASITASLLALPADTKVFVGHDYPPADRGTPRSFVTVDEQRRTNKHVRDGVSEEEFTKWRRERDASLGQPRLLHASLQVNANGGALPDFVKVPVSNKW